MSRALTREMRRRAKQWPQHLELVPEAEWPERAPGFRLPLEVWRSRHYLVQVFEEVPFLGRDARRLSINRVVLDANGQWEQNIPWEELMRCKREAGFGDWYGVEVYPRDRDIENIANMRHLWLFSMPLPIGWFDGDTSRSEA